MYRKLEDTDTIEILKKIRPVDYRHGKYNIDCLVQTNFKRIWETLIEFINFLSENVWKQNKLQEVVQTFNEINVLVNYTYNEIVGSNVTSLLENEYEFNVLKNYLKTSYKQIITRIPQKKREYYKQQLLK